ncbi:MAG: hypothetical protein HC915_07300 [Anaerolineae bacterium]|nr:hypothetical protein [Anaerolineae bacterium]
MSVNLHVANLALEAEDEQLHAVLAPYGHVLSAARLYNKLNGQAKKVALVVVEDDASAESVMVHGNGQLLLEQPLFICPETPPRPYPVTPEQKVVIDEIIAAFQETDKEPLTQIREIVQYGGIPFTRAVFQEALRLEAAGGVLTHDGTRRRTPGGVFFFLARMFLSRPAQRIIFFSRQYGKKTDEEGQEGQAKPAKKAAKPAKQQGKAPQAGTSPVPQKAPKAKKPAPAGAAGGAPSGGKGVSKGKARPSASALPARPVRPAPSPEPAIMEPLTDEIRAEYLELKATLQDAQKRLKAIQKQPASKQTGLFSLTKEIWKLESEVRALQKRYPELD